ncbi:MAG: hypothetical protein ABI277_08545 [Burkholderiaceae bacterium]
MLTIERRKSDGVEARAREAGPVVRLDPRQLLRDIVEVLQQRRHAPVVDAEEGAGEVVERTASLRLLTHPGIAIQPDQRAFFVVALRALPAAPVETGLTARDDLVITCWKSISIVEAPAGTSIWDG